jgi:hypothetical protein
MFSPPAKDGRMTSESVVCWRAFPGPCSVWLARNRPVWGVPKIDGRAGRTATLRKALLQNQDPRKEIPALIILINGRGWSPVPFQLLSRNREMALRSALARVETAPKGVERLRRRAGVYRQYGLHFEVSETLLDALKLAPEDGDLREETIAALRRIENTSEVRKLQELGGPDRP